MKLLPLKCQHGTSKKHTDLDAGDGRPEDVPVRGHGLIDDLQAIVANYQTKQIIIGCHQRWAPILQSPGLLWLVALSLWRSSSHPLGGGPGG